MYASLAFASYLGPTVPVPYQDQTGFRPQPNFLAVHQKGLHGWHVASVRDLLDGTCKVQVRVLFAQDFNHLSDLGVERQITHGFELLLGFGLRAVVASIIAVRTSVGIRRNRQVRLHSLKTAVD